MDLMCFLAQTLNRLTPVSDVELAALMPLIRISELKKSQIFIRQGDVPSSVGMVIQGLLRKYYVNKEGQEFTRDFVCQGDFFASYSSLIRNQPSILCIEALEPTQIATIEYSALKALYERSQVWERIGRLMAEDLFMRKEKREYELLMLDARARYEAFYKEYPEVRQRIPRYLVASYLGITPVSLSRLSARK